MAVVPFPLGYVQDLGLRGRDAAAPASIDWAGNTLDAQGMRALHRTLDPTIVLLALAGYDPRSALLRWDNSPAAPTVELFFDPRSAVSIADYGARTGLADTTSNGRLAIPLVRRAGLGDLPVPLFGDVADVISTSTTGDDWFDISVPTANTVSGFAGSLRTAQDGIHATLALWISNRFGLEGTDGTGLLAILDPDFWDLAEDDPDALNLRTTAEAIKDQIFAGPQELADFLMQDAQLRVVTASKPEPVRDRLMGEPEPGFDRAGARLAALGWQEATSNYWNAWLGEGWAPYRFRDQRRFGYIELVADAMNAGFLTNLVFDLTGQDVGAAYGGIEFEIGETHEGIQELRDDLDVLGFGPLHRPDSGPHGQAWATTYGEWLQAAVREFQVYASMDTVARVADDDEPDLVEPPDANTVYHHSYGSRLRPVPNTDRYTGPKSGVLNDRTRVLLKTWIDEGWVCPVAVEARKSVRGVINEIRKGRPEADPLDLVLKLVLAGDDADLTTTASKQNIWGPRQHPVTDLFVAWDVSGTRRTSATTAAGDPVMLCTYSGQSWGGPYCGYGSRDRSCLFEEAEIFAVDRPADPAQRWIADSSFRVMRAIAEVESLGYYDGMNAYDTAILSGGLQHATLALHKTTGGGNPAGPTASVLYAGELASILAFYEAEDPLEYEKSFGQFGLHGLNDWLDPPDAHYRPAHAKYADGLGFESESGGVADLRTEQRDHDRTAWPTANPHDANLGETMHHWHWVYRWLVADRADIPLRTIHDRISRARIRAMLTVPWPGIEPPVTIGHVLTSERSVALAERLHVFNPRRLLGPTDRTSEWGRSDGNGFDGPAVAEDVALGRCMHQAMNAAQQVAGRLGHASIDDWGDEEEYAIIDVFEGHADMGTDDFRNVYTWPNYWGRSGKKFAPDGVAYLTEPQPTVAIGPPSTAGAALRVTVSSTASDEAPAAEDPTELSVDVTASVDSVVPTWPGVPSAGDTDVFLEPGEWRGTVTLTITGKSRRLVTRRTQEVVVSDGPGDTVSFALGEIGDAEVIEATPALVKFPIRNKSGDITGWRDQWPVRGLSSRRHSFVLDERDLFTQPDPWNQR